MAAARAKLVIEVDDKDVAAAEKSVQRLSKAVEDSSKTTTNSFGGRKPVESEEQQRRLKAWLEKDTPAAAKKSEEAMKAVAKESDSMSAAFGRGGASGLRFAGIAGIVGVAVVAVATALYQAWQKAVELSKAFAANAIEIGNLAESMGIAAETAAALRHETEAQGRSFAVVESSLQSFRKSIGEAAAGSEKARQSLSLLGIDGQKAIYDVDGAFKLALRSIADAPNPIEQSRRAFAAFGSEWPKILPIVKEFNGDIDGAIRRAEELGIIVSGPNVAAAREFNRAYEDMKKAVEGVAYVFGSVLMPIVAGVFRDFGNWVATNRNQIRSWAESTANFARGVIGAFQDILKFINDNPLLIRILTGVVTGGASEIARNEMGQRLLMAMNPLTAGYQTFSDYGTRTGGQTVGQPTPDPANVKTPDSAAVEAMLAAQREAAERARKEAIERAKRDWDAAIQSWQMYGNEAEKALKDVFGKIKEEFERSGDQASFRDAVSRAISQYNNVILGAYQNLEKLEDEKAKRNKDTANEIQLLNQRQLQRRLDYGKATAEIMAQTEKLITEAGKKTSAERIKTLETEMNRKNELDAASMSSRFAQLDYDVKTKVASELAAIDARDEIEKRYLADRKERLENLLKQVKGNAVEETKIQHDIKLLNEEITQQEITNANRVLDVKRKKREAINKLNEQYKDLKTSLEDQLDALTRGNTPLTEYEKTLRQIQRNYRDLEEPQKQHLLAMAGQIDAVTELNKKHAEMKDFFKTTLKYAFDGDIKGLLKSFQDRFKEQMIDNLSGMLATKFLGFDPNATNNPVAKPIVSSIGTTNSILNRILVRLGGSPIASGFNPTTGGGRSLHEAIHGAFSDAASGTGPGGTPFFNPTRGGGVPPTGTIDADGNYVVNGSEQHGIFGPFKDMFGPRRNILTGKDSKAAGIMGGIGSIAAMVGGFVPGRAGKMLQYGGMGAQYGAMFGPWGAAIGAGIGALFGLFSGRDNAIKKLKEAALTAYSINVGDKSVLEAIKTIGEGYYGKGQVGKNAMAVVGLHEAQEILRNYAKTSGQSSSRLDRDLLTDEHWSGNQFQGKFGGFRERGGPVMAGRAYIVGERRPELFIPNTSGTIMPSVPNVTVNGGIDPTLIAALAESIYELKDQVAQLGVVDEGVVVKRGARAAANEIVSAASGRYNDSFTAREGTARVLQYD